MAKYIVDLQEIYEDKSDIDEYLITTDTGQLRIHSLDSLL